MDNNVTRIGLVVPPGNVAMERELAMYLADGVAMNVNRLCGSGAQAIVSAAQALMLGDADFALAGGAESMSRAP